MSQPPLIMLEVVLGFAVPLGWGVWQLLSLRRDQRAADAQRLAEEAAASQAAQADRPPRAEAPPGSMGGC